MNDKNITDVDFKEVATEAVPETEVVLFDPVDYLTGALRDAGHPNPTAWTLDIDPRAQTAPSDKDRIFFANRALGLYIAEHADRENITPRLLLVDGIDKVKWAALMEQGIVPWLMNKFDAKGKIIKDTPVVDATDLEGKEVTITANDGGPVANEDGSARQEGDFVLEPTYKENDVATNMFSPNMEFVGEDPLKVSQYKTPGVYIKLEDNDPDPQGTVETILTETSDANTRPKEVGVFEGTLNLTDGEKAIIRGFIAQSAHDHITIGDRTFAKVYRNGASGLEWYFTNGTVAYPLTAYDYLKVSNEPKVIAKVADVGAFVKLDDSFATDHAQVEAVLGDGSETHLWGNVHPNDMPVIMGMDTGTEVLPPADENGNSFEDCKAIDPKNSVE